MTDPLPGCAALHHHRRPMSGRNPAEVHRQATPLELFLDLVFVTNFGLAAHEHTHALAEGDFGVAFLGFGFASFAICWAWVNMSWFVSAYDNDDWIFRIADMVQIVGVLIVSAELPRFFETLEHGRFDNSVMVTGYVVMRVALVFQWLRAARQDPAPRRVRLAYAETIAAAQVGWVALALAAPHHAATALCVAALILAELSGPIVSERRGEGAPWHADHIVERPDGPDDGIRAARSGHGGKTGSSEDLMAERVSAILQSPIASIRRTYH